MGIRKGWQRDPIDVRSSYRCRKADLICSMTAAGKTGSSKGGTAPLLADRRVCHVWE